MANKPTPKALPVDYSKMDKNPVLTVGSVIKGASAATKIVSKIVENAVAKHGNDAVKVGQQVAKALGEHIKPSIVNAQEAEVTSAKVLKGTPSTTSSTTGSRSVTNSTDSINYVKPGRTQAQADAATRGLSTARQNTINVGSSSATQASTGLLAKGAKTGAKIGGAAGIVAGAAGAEAVDKLVNNLKNKKSGK